MLCNLGNTSAAGNDTNNNANTNSSMEDDDSYPLPTIYRYVCKTRERVRSAAEPSEFARNEEKERERASPERTEMSRRCGIPVKCLARFD